MRSNRIGRWTALLLAVAMLIALPAPAALAASAGDAQAALERTFSYYRIQRDGNLGGWEALAAACLRGTPAGV
jgi:hypothetical protein